MPGVDRVDRVGLGGGFSGGYGIVVDQDNVRVCGWFYRAGLRHVEER